jgi:hypothetical protein
MASPIAFIPFLIMYLNGDPTGVATAKSPYPTQDECMKAIQAAVTNLNESGLPAAGGKILGGCLPIPPPPDTPPAKPPVHKGPTTII